MRFSFLPSLLLLCVLLLCCLPPSLSDSADDVRYVIMIDAGSTGSRIHIHRYTWPVDGDGELTALPVIEPSINVKIKGGLSTYALAPHNASNQVRDLLATARQNVPEPLRSSTPIHLQATAGLRSVTPAQAAAIVSVVRSSLRDSEFLFEDEWALIISGEQEGINGWLATNYLLGAFDPSTSTEPHGVVEMGGASMQITFAPQSTARLSQSELKRLAHLSIAGRSYYLYTHSYLQYGLQAAQRLYQQLMMEEIEDEGNPCYPQGYRHSSTGNFNKCFSLMERVVDKKKECEMEPCSFNGVWQPKIASEPFLAIENFFYTTKFFARDEGVIKKGAVITPNTGNALVKTLKEKGMEFCDDPWTQILADHAEAIQAKTEDVSSLSYYCFAAAYEAAVLETGFGFEDRSNIRPARTIEGKAIDWEMGATLIEVMKAHDRHVQQNPQVTAWRSSLWFGRCTMWTCSSSVVLVLIIAVGVCVSCCRAMRKNPSSRGYSMLPYHSSDRGGGLSSLFSKV